MWDSDTWQLCDEEGGSRFVDGFRCVALMAHSGAVEAHVGSIGPNMKLKLADVDLSLSQDTCAPTSSRATGLLRLTFDF